MSVGDNKAFQYTSVINLFLCICQPIPVENLLVEDLSDGDVRMGGSFKTAISRLGTGERERAFS